MLDTIVKIKYYIETNTLSIHENDDDIKEFKTTKPKLYSMLMNKDCDVNMLYNLIKLQDNIKNGLISKEDAEKQFGEIAAKRYVYPLINE